MLQKFMDMGRFMSKIRPYGLYSLFLTKYLLNRIKLCASREVNNNVMGNSQLTSKYSFAL